MPEFRLHFKEVTYYSVVYETDSGENILAEYGAGLVDETDREYSDYVESIYVYAEPLEEDTDDEAE